MAEISIGTDAIIFEAIVLGFAGAKKFYGADAPEIQIEEIGIGPLP